MLTTGEILVPTTSAVILLVVILLRSRRRHAIISAYLDRVHRSKLTVSGIASGVFVFTASGPSNGLVIMITVLSTMQYNPAGPVGCAGACFH